MAYANMEMNDALYYIQARLVRGAKKGVAICEESIQAAILRAYGEEPDWQIYTREALLLGVMKRNAL